MARKETTVATMHGDAILSRRSAFHRLGTVTDNAMTAQEAIEKAHLNTTVTKQPCFAFVDGEYVEVEDKYVTGSYHPMKPELWRPHGVVGSQYEVIQNAEQFAVLDAIRDSSDAIYETAGSMNNGSRVFLTMKLPETLTFNGGEDVVDLYLFAQNSHDGSKAFTIAVTPIRLVCTNQITTILKTAKRTFTMKHTKNVMTKVNEAREILGLTFTYVEEFEKEVEWLINRPMNDNQFHKFARTYAGIDLTNAKQKEAKAQQKVDTLMSLWTADTQLVAGRNQWSAYNAVVEYVDWYSGTRKQKAKDDETARAMRTLSNSADIAKDRAFKILQSI